jgi:predicted PurR-regulated permease PerM
MGPTALPLTLGLVVSSTLVLLPMWPPLVLAVWTAGLTRPMLLRFERGLHGRRRAAAVLSLMLFLVVAAPPTPSWNTKLPSVKL